MKKIIILFVPIFVLSLIIYSLTPLISKSENISNKVFRLHIIANSDSEEDQQLKLQVKDRILKYAAKLYCECNSVSDAVKVSKEHIKDIKSTAQSVLAFYGYDYNVSAYTDKEFFSTRVYDGFALPAGNYNTLKIVIGEGKGKNWWCVMYPSVCISGCTDDFDKALSQGEKEIITDKNI